MAYLDTTSWTNEQKQRVESFIKVILALHTDEEVRLQYNIETSWTDGNPCYMYEVKNATKKLIAERMFYDLKKDDNTDQSFIENQINTAYKDYVQGAMTRLGDIMIQNGTLKGQKLGLQILQRHSPLKGAKAKFLHFTIKLPSQDQDKIMQYIDDMWYKKVATQQVVSLKKLSIELSVVAIEGEIIKYHIKVKADLATLENPQKRSQIHQRIKEIAKDPNVEIVAWKKGCVVIELEGALEGFNRIESQINSGELTEILGFPILEIQQLDEIEDYQDNISFQLAQWFEGEKISDWLYDIGTKAARLAVKSYQQLTGDTGLQPALLKNASDNIPQDNQVNINDLLELLNSNDNQEKIRGAYELGNQLKNTNHIPKEIIDALANAIEKTNDQETSWQLALTLGKLDPEHLKGAVAQTKNIEFSDDDWFELFIALRISEDELIDVLVQISSATEETLPIGLKVSLLDETEVSFQEKITDSETITHLTFDFTGALGEIFSIKFSLGDNEMIENFQI